MHQRRACEKASWEAMIEQVIIMGRSSIGRKISLGEYRKIHATGSGPSGLGMMQPEGRPQQGKLKA